jgi:thiamine-phosphate pyrophosphorylase
MAKKTKRKTQTTTPRAEARPKPRLYLVTPPLSGPREFAPKLEAALAAADVACVLVMPASGGADVRATVGELSSIAARHGAALLVSAPAAVAKAADADGVNVRGSGPELAESIGALKPDLIVGASGLRSRHDAMSAGELDIDYLMFGDPAPDGWTPPMEDTLERIAWWAEIFNVPCVGFAGALDQVGPLVAAGADFVALGDVVWNDPRGPAEAVRAAMALLRAPVEAE